MTKFNTGNPIGSADPRDLSDNAKNLDSALNDGALTWTDRLGNARKTFQGAVSKIGYEAPISYTGGISFSTSDTTKTVEDAGIVYAPLPSSLPFTTDGTFSNDAGKFYPVQGLVEGDAVIPVTSRTAMKAYDVPADSKFSFDGSQWTVKSGTPPTDTKEIFFVVLNNGNYAERSVKGKVVPIEYAQGVPDDSSATARTANEEALAAIESFNYQPLLASDSSYYFSAGYDLWQHRFAAGRSCSAFIDATEYDVSNAIWGIYRIDDFGAGTNNYLTLRNARDNIVIARIARGDESAASHVLQLPLDIRRDSHSLISQAGTAGGTSDILFRNSDNEDLHYINNDTTEKRLVFSYNTSTAPTYSFDEAMSLPTETTTDPIQFPTLPVNFAAAEFTNPRSGLLLARAPGGNRTVGVTKSFSDLPFSDEFIRKLTEDYWHASGIVEFSFVSNTGVFGRRRQQFEWAWDGAANLTVTDEANTLPAGVTATLVAISTDRLGISLDFDDTAGSGTDCQISVRVDFSYTAI